MAARVRHTTANMLSQNSVAKDCIFTFWNIMTFPVCSAAFVKPAVNPTDDISLTPTQTFALSPSLVLSLWKHDTAAQTSLNNENMLSGSSASWAQPASCQTVNAVLKWRGKVGEKSLFIFAVFSTTNPVGEELSSSSRSHCAVVLYSTLIIYLASLILITCFGIYLVFLFLGFVLCLDGQTRSYSQLGK